jgi:hypothetical protein
LRVRGVLGSNFKMEGACMQMKTRWASYILALVLALRFGSLTVAAQEKTTGGKAVTVTGCLQKGDEAGEYSITSEDGRHYELRSKTVGLAKHVGRRVSVTGTQVREENEAKKEKEAKESGEGEYADLRVTDLKMVSDSCK